MPAQRRRDYHPRRVGKLGLVDEQRILEVLHHHPAFGQWLAGWIAEDIHAAIVAPEG